MFLSDLMLRKAFKQIKLILSAYPRKHIYLLTMGVAMMLSIVFFSNIELGPNSSKESLYNKISIEDLGSKVNKDILIPKLIEFKKTEIKRNDITGLLDNTKKLATMYTELLKVKRKGWENILEKQQKAEKGENAS